jgi:hypothetical protein
MQAEIIPVPIETPYWNRVGHGWPLDLQVLRGFLIYFLTFLLQDEQAIIAGGVFCECENHGKRKGVIGKNKTQNRGLNCEYLSFGSFGASFAGQFAYKQIVTMS